MDSASDLLRKVSVLNGLSNHEAGDPVLVEEVLVSAKIFFVTALPTTPGIVNIRPVSLQQISVPCFLAEVRE